MASSLPLQYHRRARISFSNLSIPQTAASRQASKLIGCLPSPFHSSSRLWRRERKSHLHYERWHTQTQPDRRTGCNRRSIPSFTLPDAINGKPIRSADLLSIGPLIVNFFRGRWCPYCMTELEAWQQAYPAVREKGALLVAISPQLPRHNDFTVQQHRLTFPVLSDAGADLAAQFGITYQVPEPLQQHYRSILVNIPFINGSSGAHGETTWRLPLPATFVIASSGEILFAEAYADHRVRPDPADVLAVL
jgi:peroxiredoxin